MTTPAAGPRRGPGRPRGSTGRKRKRKRSRKQAIREGAWTAKMVRELRARRDLSRARLSETLGVMEVTVSSWEYGLSVPNLINTRKLEAINRRPGAEPVAGGEPLPLPEPPRRVSVLRRIETELLDLDMSALVPLGALGLVRKWRKMLDERDE